MRWAAGDAKWRSRKYMETKKVKQEDGVVKEEAKEKGGRAARPAEMCASPVALDSPVWGSLPSPHVSWQEREGGI